MKRAKLLGVALTVGISVTAFTAYVDAAPAYVFKDQGVCDGENGSTVVIANNGKNAMFSCRGTNEDGFPELTVLKNTGVCDGLGLGSAHRDQIVLHPSGNYSIGCTWK